MNEIKYRLTDSQRTFLEKCIVKIEKGGFQVYSTSTISGMLLILDRGYYTDVQRGWLNAIRGDYIVQFCMG